MPAECVIDTGVLQKANAVLRAAPRPHSDFCRRTALLAKIEQGELRVLVSSKLLAEYHRQVREPRNDFVKAFFQLLDQPARRVLNWPRWAGIHRGAVQKCRFPAEDTHLLRTALRPKGATIYTEERRILLTDACIHRELRVHVRRP